MTDPANISLETQVPDHAQGLFTALQDPRIYRFLDEDAPATIDAVRQRIIRLSKGGPPDGSERWLNWTVFRNDRIVGTTQATVTPGNRASIAYVMSPDVWGTGVAATAVTRMTQALVRQFATTHFIADTETGNLASQRLLVRLGLRDRLGPQDRWDQLGLRARWDQPDRPARPNS